MDNIQKIYSNEQQTYEVQKQHWDKINTLLIVSRLVISLALLYSLYNYFFDNFSPIWLLTAGVFSLVFVLLMRYHKKILIKRRLTASLIEINKNEIDFLQGNVTQFANGASYIDTNHLYTHDLDIFGAHSLYQYINRTTLITGAQTLANWFSTSANQSEIIKRQEAVKELTQQLTWRQQYTAKAKTINNDESTYQYIINWTKTPNRSIAIFYRIAAFLLPICFVILLALHFFTTLDLVYLILVVFSVNVSLVFSKLKQLKQELDGVEKINDALYAYADMLMQIEQEDFKSEKLKQIQERLSIQGIQASKLLENLAAIFARIETIQNAVGSFLLNGICQYHIHALYALYQYKKLYAKDLIGFVECIGELEALNSVANFSYNNPQYAFPVLNDQYQIEWTQMGHPLLSQDERICNTVSFSQGQMIVLTGSNMSGKSTFLRSLGVNMVLTAMGAPVCAIAASIHPLPVIVSMRLVDSLNDGASYFLAEVKRLQQLMECVSKEICFVLLDEILRGTNSDDKRLGTIEVIKKLQSKKAMGVVATHDLEVCEIAQIYPEAIVNKCFEVEINNGDLFFDYQLRDGICKNKSAYAIMKSRGVI